MNRLVDGEVALWNSIPDDKYRLTELANNTKVSDNLREGFPSPYVVAEAE